MGPYWGGQAEYLRVPWADFTELAGVEPGRTVAVFGAGPVGLMAALPLDDAVHAYDQFDKRIDGWTKVILHPGQAA
jgi:threonine dehydrogenase-like Zn-dependent dehydrogenase